MNELESIKTFERKIMDFVSDDLLDVFQKSAEPMQELMANYRGAMMAIETKFKILNEQFSARHNRNPIESIVTRVKSPESIFKKLRKLDLMPTIDAIEKNLKDVAGVRVICSFVDDIYSMADFILSQDDVKLLEMKDYIKEPKKNGYRSMHLIVEVPIFLSDEKKYMKVEVQLRTIAMDFWASLEHRMRYKKKVDPCLAERLETELRECAQTGAMLDWRMKKLRDMIEEPD